MKIIGKLLVILILLLGFAAFNLGSVYVQIDRMTNDGRVINFTGIVRGGSQRLVKLELAGQTQEQPIAYLERVINGLIDGDRELQLTKATDNNFLAQMRRVEQKWDSLKQTIQAVRQDAKQQSRLVQESEAFWQATNQAVFAAEQFSLVHVQVLKKLQIFIFIANLILLAIICRIVKNIVAVLQGTIRVIASSSTEMALTVEEQQRVVTQQAASVNQTTTTMDRMRASSRHSAQQAEVAAASSNQALALTQGGSAAVERSQEAMSILQQQIATLGVQIGQLSQQMGQISSISGMVGELANQTNMLALNAAVEAVRAREYGKGFGVIASEIRKLADQSKQSAAQIHALVIEIQAAINSTVRLSDEGSKTVETGVKIAREAATALSGVVGAIDNIAASSQQISLTAQQQAIAIEQVVQAMNSLNAAAKSAAIGISQTQHATQKLNETALELKAMIYR